MTGFKFTTPGAGKASLPEVKPETAAPVAEVKAAPVVKAKAAPTKKLAKTTEKADQQLVTYITPSELEAFKELMDGRPASKFIRRLIQKALA